MSTSENENARLFAAMPAVDEEANARLHARLVAAAERDGVLDVAYRTIATPVGELLLATTGQGLVRVAYPGQGPRRGAGVARAGRQPAHPARARAAGPGEPADRRVLRRRSAPEFDLPLDFRLATGFRRTVLTHLPAIPYGHTESYAQVAAASGSPKAFRAVGTACANNPLPVVVPCHRVVHADGTAGAYVGGADAKHALLALESAA